MTQDPSDPAAPRLDFAAVSARRMRRQFLDPPSAGATPADVAARMCSTHAQVMPSAELAIGLRLDGAPRRTTQEALWRSRTLVKPFGPRGTLHLLPTAEYPMWIGALSALPPLPNSHRKDVKFAPEQTTAVVAAIGEALSDAELTADELDEAVVDIAGPWAGERTMPAFQGHWPRWRQSMADAALRGALCFAPNRGRNVVYTSPRRWLPGFRPEPGDTALPHLLQRYLHAYGPATPAHFARWLAVPPRFAAELFERAGAALQRVEVGGEPAWVAAGDTELPASPAPPVRLLPYFDQFVVAGAFRELLFPGEAAGRALSPAGQAGNFPVLLLDGVVGGVWHQRKKGRRIEVTVEPLRPLSAAQRRALDDEVTRIGQVLEATPTLTVGTVSVGGHA